MLKWLLAQFRGRSDAMHAAPVDQPDSVHDLSENLFNAYELDNGTVQLAGCNLEDRPVLRLTYVEMGGTTIFHCYVDADGNYLTPDDISSLSLEELKSLPAMPPTAQVSDLDARIQKADEQVRGDLNKRDEGLTDLSPESRPEMIVATLIWCKYATGKLAFEFGTATTEIEFSGWTSHLASGAEMPPPYTCPVTGQQSYEMLLSDNQITVSDALSVCEETGDRVPESDLQKCAVSNKSVRSDQLEECPITESRVLRSLLRECSLCGLKVSPECVRSERCMSCRRLTNVEGDDSRLKETFSKFPSLRSEWKRWSFAENKATIVIVATTMTKQMVVVLDKPELEARRVATAGRLFAKWNVASENEFEELLGK